MRPFPHVEVISDVDVVDFFKMDPQGHQYNAGGFCYDCGIAEHEVDEHTVVCIPNLEKPGTNFKEEEDD